MDFLAELFNPKKKKRTRRRRRRKSRKARGQEAKVSLPGPPKLTRTVAKSTRPAAKSTRPVSPIAAALVIPTLARQHATTLSVVPPVVAPRPASPPQKKKKSVNKTRRRVPLPALKRKGPIKRY